MFVQFSRFRYHIIRIAGLRLYRPGDEFVPSYQYPRIYIYKKALYSQWHSAHKM